MKTLLLVTHRGIDETGGASARWKAFKRYLPEHGWDVEVVSAPARVSAVEFTADTEAQRRVATRARVMGRVGSAADPIAGLFGVKPEAFPPSMAWARAGARDVRARLGEVDAIVATGPPMVALVAARMALGRAGASAGGVLRGGPSGAGAGGLLRGGAGGAAASGPPFIAELRDLWAGSPAFDRRGGLLTRLESWIFSRASAVVVMTPEAERDVAARHPALASRIEVVPNGFDPALRDHAAAPRTGGRITLIHSGIVTRGRSPGPLIDVLAREPYRDRFRLVLHGYLTPDVAAEVARADRAIVEVIPPSSWDDAAQRIASADAGVVLQGAAVGDATAVASKVFEYLALGKPVLTVTDGGATEALLRRLGAGALCARIADGASIAAALDRLLEGTPPPPAPEAIDRFDRRRLAGEMAALLDELTRARPALAYR